MKRYKYEYNANYCRNQTTATINPTWDIIDCKNNMKIAETYAEKSAKLIIKALNK